MTDVMGVIQWPTLEALVADLTRAGLTLTRSNDIVVASDPAPRDVAPLSSRLRPDVECAPWVIDAVRRIEADAQASHELAKRLHDDSIDRAGWVDLTRAQAAMKRAPGALGAIDAALTHLNWTELLAARSAVAELIEAAQYVVDHAPQYGTPGRDLLIASLVRVRSAPDVNTTTKGEPQ